MACLIIAEINKHLIEIYSLPVVINHINSLNLDGITPSFAEKIDEDILNQLHAFTKHPIWLPEHGAGYQRAQDQCYSSYEKPSVMQFFEQGGDKQWKNLTTKAPEKNELAALLQACLQQKCNQNVAVVSPLAITPVVIALRSICRFDSYLFKHYFKQFEPTLALMTPSIAQDILEWKLSEFDGRSVLSDKTTDEASSAYLRLERKLHRQYTAH